MLNLTAARTNRTLNINRMLELYADQLRRTNELLSFGLTFELRCELEARLQLSELCIARVELRIALH